MRKFGGTRVARSDVLDFVADKPRHTLQADLVRADHIPADTFDCIICTQTLQMIFDIRAAVAQLWRILVPGGVLLVTSHGISRISRREGVDDWGEYWHLTRQSAHKLFAEAFTTGSFTVAAYGNVLAAVAELHGLAAEELSRDELDYHDPNYEVIVGVRAMKNTASR
jgi:SAM-dependent methyltransferase